MADKKQKLSNSPQKASTPSSASQVSKHRAKNSNEHGIKDFSTKIRDQPEQDSLTRILNQLAIGDSSTQKAKHNRNRSSKATSSPAPELTADDMGEDNVLDLLSGPTDSKAILQFYKRR